MSAVEALRDGDVDRALADLQDEVRAAPAEPRHRIFLFQLLAVLGQWERALTQLHVVRDLDPAAIAMVRTYEQVIRCERLRQDVFSGQRTPLVLGDPDPWVAQLVEGVRLAADGNWQAAQRLRDEAYEAAPASPGTIRVAAGSPSGAEQLDAAFEWLADADSRLGPILEAIVNGRYYWVPLHRIAVLELEPPTDLRDLVWLPARFLWTNQGEAVGLIPVRYPASEASPDPLLRLARRTDWQEPIEGYYQGLGQRLLATDDNEYAILNVRRIEFAPAAG